MVKHPADKNINERKFTDFFPMPGISLILASITWIIFSFYFVAMLKDHCHRVKELRRLAAVRKPVKGDVVENKHDSLRNSLRNPLLPADKEEKKEVKPSKENLSKEGLNSPEKLSAEKTDKTDRNVNPSAEPTTPSKEVLREKGEETGGDIKPSAEMTNKPDKATPSAESAGGGKASAEVISPSAEALNQEMGSAVGASSEVLKEPKSDGAALTFSEMMKKKKKSAETFKDTPEGRAKQAVAKKTWQQVQHKQSAEIIEENWRREHLGGKTPTAAKDLSKEANQPKKKKEICASSENIVVTASAEAM